ncbi:hypothetical protein HQ560_04800 [bacterium]|nr:hypothetical protein [bacterium]
MASELALLVLFVYIPVILGGLYVAWLSVGRQRVREAAHAALYPRHDEADSGSGELHEAFKQETKQAYFNEFTGDPEVEGRWADDRDVPMNGKMREMFEAFAEPMYHPPSASAHGGFRLEGGRVVYSESVRIRPEHWSIRPEGQVVNSLRLLDDDIPENLTEHLQEYLRRRVSFASYEHSIRPGHTQGKGQHDYVVEGDKDVKGWNLQVPNEEQGQRDGWRPEATVRWTKQRMVDDQSPPAFEQRGWIGAPTGFPDAEPSDDFWNPN